MSDWTQEQIHLLVENQRTYFKSGKTLNLDKRIEMLSLLKDAMYRYEEQITEALYKDLGQCYTEAYFSDIGTVLVEINEALKGLKKWARPKTHFSGPVCFPSLTTKVYKMPYGVTLIISPFNFPIVLSFGVLVAAIAGGNTAIIKTSSKSVACSELMSKIIAEIYPPEYVTVVGGGHDVADMCLEERFDKIFYTGSTTIGKHVLEKAAKNLTPVALELGGETGNWCVIRADADVEDAARKIAFFKIYNAGQICLNVNQVAVASEVADHFVECLKREFTRQIGNAIDHPEYPKLVSRASYDKCANEADQYRDRIVYGGNGNPETCKYAPTVIYPVNIDEPIVQHELFCPLLPVVVYRDSKINDLLSTIADREHGLTFYLFTRDIKWAKKVMQTQQYGGGCINEVCVHMMVKGAPFGGTGHSGMGAYHGEWGFREFTHPCTVLFGDNHFNLSVREHPYTSGKLKIFKLFEK